MSVDYSEIGGVSLTVRNSGPCNFLILILQR